MNRIGKPAQIRCAIYTRKSTEEGLEQAFNTLDAQREAGEAYIASQKAEGWVCVPDRYDDGGYTGGNMDRPAVTQLMKDIEAGKIDCVVVYKVDRLSRSLLDFARMMETFEKHHISFVSVTQHFNTTHSMGRLTLNILLSFAQFEREIISERTRDKIAATRRKGKWSGGTPMLGYDIDPKSRKLIVNTAEAKQVQAMFQQYVERQSLIQTATLLNEQGWRTKSWTTSKGQQRGGRVFDKANLRGLLTNVLYLGKVRYKDEVHPGEHEGIVTEDVWQRANCSLQGNGRTGGAHVRNKHGALLKGLLHCKPCKCAMGHSYTTKGKRCYRYYICYTAQKQGWDACQSKSLPAEEIEKFVVGQIGEIGKDPAVMAMALQQARSRQEETRDRLDADIEMVEREIRRLNGEIRTAARAATNDGAAVGTLATLHDQHRAGERRLVELRAQVDELANDTLTKQEVDAALGAFGPMWETLTAREQNRVLRLLIQRVEYDGASGKVAVTFHANGLRTLGQIEVTK